MKSVDEIATVTRYAPKFDFEKFKEDFAVMVAVMENKSEKETKKTWIMTWKEIVSSISHRKVAA